MKEFYFPQNYELWAYLFFPLGGSYGLVLKSQVTNQLHKTVMRKDGIKDSENITSRSPISNIVTKSHLPFYSSNPFSGLTVCSSNSKHFTKNNSRNIQWYPSSNKFDTKEWGD